MSEVAIYLYSLAVTHLRMPLDHPGPGPHVDHSDWRHGGCSPAARFARHPAAPDPGTHAHRNVPAGSPDLRRVLLASGYGAILAQSGQHHRRDVPGGSRRRLAAAGATYLWDWPRSCGHQLGNRSVFHPRLHHRAVAAGIAGLGTARATRVARLRMVSCAVAGIAGRGRLLGYIILSNPARGLDQGGEYFHQFWPSLAATLLSIVPDLSLGDGSPAGIGGPASVVVAALLFLGFIWASRAGFGAAPPWRQMAALCVGLLGCFVLTIFSSSYEYGAQAHEAQTTLRECLVVLGLLAAARIVEPGLPRLPARWLLPAHHGPNRLDRCSCHWNGRTDPGADRRL